MKKLRYTQDIKAPAREVYRTMLGLDQKETHEQWTEEFHPGSTYEGSWEKGSKILFVGPGENGKRVGMVSEIAENIPFKFISIRHYGIVEDDQEITEGPEVEKWAGGFENYAFEENNGTTTVKIEVDVTDDFVDYFNTAWPRALNKLSEVVEKRTYYSPIPFPAIH